VSCRHRRGGQAELGLVIGGRSLRIGTIVAVIVSGKASIALGAVGTVVAAALWWRANPSGCPYGQRFWVEAPHPLITRRRLREVLSPRPGERVLEVGPGTGYYTLDVAHWLSRPAGWTFSTSSRRCSTTRCAGCASAG
jgi:hypothetical protein